MKNIHFDYLLNFVCLFLFKSWNNIFFLQLITAFFSIIAKKEGELVAKQVLLEIKGKELIAVTKAKSPDQSNPESIELKKYEGIKIDQSVVPISPEIMQHSIVDEESCCSACCSTCCKKIKGELKRKSVL